MSATLVIADTQDLTTAGIRYLLTSTDISILAEANKFEHLWRIFKKEVPDALILDHTKLKDFQLTQFLSLHQEYSSVGVLIISTDENKDTIIKLLEAGVTGYLTKDCSKEEILMALRATVKGEKFFCHKVLDILIEDRVKKVPSEESVSGITEREIQIIQLVARGNSTQRIAQELNLSPHTINSHRKNILKKLKIKSPAELVIYAIDKGLITIQV
jgi:DNA-binding NarL/FixJ family response regulator